MRYIHALIIYSFGCGFFVSRAVEKFNSGEGVIFPAAMSLSFCVLATLSILRVRKESLI